MRRLPLAEPDAVPDVGALLAVPVAASCPIRTQSAGPAAETHPHPFLAPVRCIRQRLAKVGANEAKPFVEVNGDIVAIEDPEKGRPDARRLQLVEDGIEHERSNAGPAAFWRDPDVFQVALVERRLRFAGDAKQARQLAVARPDVPFSAVEFLAPLAVGEISLLVISREKRVGRFPQCCQPDIPQRKPLVAAETPDI